MEEKKEKRVLRIELDDDVKKVSITGKNGDEQVVMSQELNEDDLDQVAGGVPPPPPLNHKFNDQTIKIMEEKKEKASIYCWPFLIVCQEPVP